MPTDSPTQAELGCAEVRSRTGGPLRRIAKQHNDLATEADRATERLIMAAIRARPARRPRSDRSCHTERGCLV